MAVGIVGEPDNRSRAGKVDRFSLEQNATLHGRGELRKREHVLPLLKTNIAQIDGSIRPAFSSFSGASTLAESMEQFGLEFYQELFAEMPTLKDTVFKDKPLDLLALKIGTIMGEIVRLLEINSPQAMAVLLAEMALKHVAYGLEPMHAAPFRNAMLSSLKRVVTHKGHKWHGKNNRAWTWALNEILRMLVDATVAARGRIQLLERMWKFLCKNSVAHDFSSRSKQNRSEEGTKLNGHDVAKTPDAETGASLAPSAKARKLQNIARAFRLFNRAHAKSIPELGSSKQEPSVSIAPAAPSSRAASRPMTNAIRMLSSRPFRAASRLKGNAAKARHPLKTGDASQVVTEFPLWVKKLPATDGHEEYFAGRKVVGQRFLETFSKLNPWAVQDFQFGLNPKHAEKMGLALELIATGATKPAVLHQRLRALALGHVQMGVKPEMFPHFQKALFQFLEASFKPFQMWDQEGKEAWEFVWKLVDAAFSTQLRSAEHNLRALKESWTYFEANHDLADMSHRFFALLFRRSPVLQQYFVKPRKLQAVMFMKAIKLIVDSVENIRVLEEDVKAIAMRHIKYDITQEHLSVFGECLIATLADVLGVENWDENIEAAWTDMYAYVAQVFGYVISTGRNLVSKALATGVTAELQSALDKTPRSKRILAALEIEVDDTVVSPIVWALLEGQPAMAEVLITDVLAIRGDREAYYYGCELLWAKHPWIVQLLIQRGPHLLRPFLDGHLWSSRFSHEGGRRVNFYVRELYGNPFVPQNSNVYNTTLGAFVSRLPDTELHLYSHPCIDFVINLKWQQYARTDFLVGQLMNILSLALYTTYMHIGTKQSTASLVLACFQVSVTVARLVQYAILMVKQYKGGNVMTVHVFNQHIPVPHSLVDIFTQLSLVICMLAVAMLFLTYKLNAFGWKSVLGVLPGNHVPSHDLQQLGEWANTAAVMTALLWLQMIEVVKLAKPLAALLFSLTSLLYSLVSFGAVIITWIAGFSVMLYWMKVAQHLHEGQEFHEAMHVQLADGIETDEFGFIYFVLMSNLGLTGMQFILESSWLVRITYAFGLLAALLIILNLLVSTMVSTYERLQRSFGDLAMKSRAALVVRSEVALSLSHRQKYFQALGFDKPLEFDMDDEGPPGGLQAIMDTKLVNHVAFDVLDRVDRYVGSLDPEQPWRAEDQFSSALNSQELYAQSGFRGRSNALAKALEAVSFELDRAASQVFVIRREMKPNAPSEGQSSVSGGDPLEDSAGPPFGASHSKMRESSND